MTLLELEDETSDELLEEEEEGEEEVENEVDIDDGIVVDTTGKVTFTRRGVETIEIRPEELTLKEKDVSFRLASSVPFNDKE